MKSANFDILKSFVNGGNEVRIDKFLNLSFPDRSRSYFQRLIALGNVSCDGHVVTKTSFQVPAGSSVSVVFIPDAKIVVSPQPIELDVIAEHDDFIVINKPVGISVHPSASRPAEITLVNGLLARFPEIAGCGEPDRPGIVHRLDKGTSGLMLVARTKRGYDNLITLFKSRQITKQYVAVVAGHPPREGEISLPIGRHPVHRQRMACNGVAAKPAHTRYRVVQYKENQSILDVWPTTGRTHQIRVHLAHLRHPILGDLVYGTSESKKIKAERLMLHAVKLSFIYDGSLKEFGANFS